MFWAFRKLPSSSNTFAIYLQIERCVNNLNVWRHHAKKHRMDRGFKELRKEVQIAYSL